MGRRPWTVSEPCKTLFLLNLRGKPPFQADPLTFGRPRHEARAVVAMRNADLLLVLGLFAAWAVKTFWKTILNLIIVVALALVFIGVLGLAGGTVSVLHVT
jgi:hypothetical protein